MGVHYTAPSHYQTPCSDRPCILKQSVLHYHPEGSGKVRSCSAAPYLHGCGRGLRSPVALAVAKRTTRWCGPLRRDPGKGRPLILPDTGGCAHIVDSRSVGFRHNLSAGPPLTDIHKEFPTEKKDILPTPRFSWSGYHSRTNMQNRPSDMRCTSWKILQIYSDRIDTQMFNYTSSEIMNFGNNSYNACTSAN